MYTLLMPMFAGTRAEAAALYADQQIPDRLDGQCFVLLCREIRRVSDTFVDAVVQHALERGVAEVALVGAPPEVVDDAKEAAWRRGVPDVVAVRRAVEVGV